MCRLKAISAAVHGSKRMPIIVPPKKTRNSCIKQRRRLQELDVAECDDAQRLDPRQARREHKQSDDAAAQNCQPRQPTASGAQPRGCR